IKLARQFLIGCDHLSQLDKSSHDGYVHLNGAVAIEAPCSPPEADRESSKCKEVIPFYCSSLANPAAPKAGSPPRYNKTCRRAQVESLRGMRSLKHFQGDG
ncbi:MAG: hypothetical protein WBG51_03015, partial [Syntrophobacteria bacterium]